MNSEQIKAIAESSYDLSNAEAHSARSRIAATHAADQLSAAERGTQAWLAAYDEAKLHLLRRAIDRLIEES